VRWWWRRKPTNGTAHARAEQEAKLRAAQRMTPVYEQWAERIADLPADELAARMRLAMTIVRHS
jgi:hypothetical protein